jgi:hypothetical protein
MMLIVLFTITILLNLGILFLILFYSCKRVTPPKLNQKENMNFFQKGLSTSQKKYDDEELISLQRVDRGDLWKVNINFYTYNRRNLYRIEGLAPNTRYELKFINLVIPILSTSNGVLNMSEQPISTALIDPMFLQVDKSLLTDADLKRDVKGVFSDHNIQRNYDDKCSMIFNTYNSDSHTNEKSCAYIAENTMKYEKHDQAECNNIKRCT